MRARYRDVLKRLSYRLLVCSVAVGASLTVQGQSLESDGQHRLSATDSDYSKVSIFGVEGHGNKFVYLFDRSASMEGAPLAAAKRRLVESIETIGDLQQFHIIFFNQRLLSLNITGGARRIAFATERNKKSAARFVSSVKADGGTDRFAALKHALAIRPDVIFFLSDADGPMTSKEMAEIARLNERIGSQICVIEFGSGDTIPKNNFLTQLASESGGQYAYVNVEKLPR
jgi:Mg-chelatase subunit ChlD